MVKSVLSYSQIEQLEMVLHGTDFAMHEANNDKEIYEKYLKDETFKLNENQKEDICLLNMLKDLGFSLDELGTYLYKDVIKEVSNVLKSEEKNEIELKKSLLSELNNSYSNFYRWIARDDKEIGVTTFHLYIQKAIENLSEITVEDELLKEKITVKNYGVKAYLFASYNLLKNLNNNAVNQESNLSDISDKNSLKRVL